MARLNAEVLKIRFNGGSTEELVVSRPVGGCGGCSGGRCPICPLRSVSVDFRVSGFKSSEYTTVLKATSIVSAEGSLAIGPARLRYETYIPKSTEKKCSKCSPNPCHCEGK